MHKTKRRPIFTHLQQQLKKFCGFCVWQHFCLERFFSASCDGWVPCFNRKPSPSMGLICVHRHIRLVLKRGMAWYGLAAFQLAESTAMREAHLVADDAMGTRTCCRMPVGFICLPSLAVTSVQSNRQKCCKMIYSADSIYVYTQWTIKTWQFIFEYNFG